MIKKRYSGEHYCLAKDKRKHLLTTLFRRRKMNLNDLIAQIQAAANNNCGSVSVTINFNKPEPVTPATDFEVDDRVLVCHICKDGVTRKHTMGTVIEVLQQDDKGWYTRVLGDNGKHYRTGLVYNEERLGTMCVMLDEDL